MRSRTERLAPRLLAALLLSASLAAGGCNIVGPLYYFAAGPGDVEKVFDLDPDRKTVIFVDDPANKIAQRRIRANIGATAQDVILSKKLVREGNMIDARSAIAAASRDGADGPLAVTEVGELVGAEVVVYVLVTRFGLSSDGIAMAPTAEAEVKIFDVPGHARIWPPEGQPGFALAVAEERTGDATMPGSRTAALQAQTSLADLLGLGIAQLFYDVEIPQSVRR